MTDGDPQYEISKAFFASVGDKVAEGPARTFNSIWGISTGWIDVIAKKLHAKQELHVKQFKESLKEEISEMPLKHQQEPKLSVNGSALESTKYYIEDEKLRGLFINLISKAMDDRYNDDVNHAFVDIIKQLSPADAYFLKKINFNTLPAARYLLKFENIRYIYLNDYFMIDDFFNSKQSSISLNNLSRLGLINMPEDKAMMKEGAYEEYFRTKEYYEYKSNESFVILKEKIDKLMRENNNDKEIALQKSNLSNEVFENVIKFEKIDLQKTHISLTSFGTAFYKVCVD